MKTSHSNPLVAVSVLVLSSSGLTVKMPSTKMLQKIALPFVFGFVLGGCSYEKVEPLKLPSVTRPVSFSGDIIPIFNSNCNSSRCHGRFGTLPNLTPLNAYKALRNGSYVSVGDPEKSEIIQWMAGKRSMPMPPNGIDLNNTAFVLAWIQQGALDN